MASAGLPHSIRSCDAMLRTLCILLCTTHADRAAERPVICRSTLSKTAPAPCKPTGTKRVLHNSGQVIEGDHMCMQVPVRQHSECTRLDEQARCMVPRQQRPCSCRSPPSPWKAPSGPWYLTIAILRTVEYPVCVTQGRSLGRNLLHYGRQSARLSGHRPASQGYC